MKTVFISGIFFSILLPLSGNLSAQDNISTQAESSEKEMEMSGIPGLKKNKEGVRKLYEDIFNTGKFDSLNEIVAEEYIGISGQKGPTAFAEPIRELRRGFPNIQYTVEDLVAEGDRVVVKWTWRGIHTGPFRGFAASERQVANHGMAIFLFKDDKIVQSWIETDRLGFLQQIGIVPQDLGLGQQSPSKNN